MDVAPALGGGAEAAPVLPELNLIDVAPLDPPSSGVVDPGPGPASARLFWEEQNATAVAEQAALRPLPNDDFDRPATALEAYLQDADAAARTSREPSPGGHPPSSSKSPGGKAPFRKAPPPALVVETPEVKVGKAPPVPYPDHPIAFLAEQPKKPPVKRAPVPPKPSQPAADAAPKAVPVCPSAASSSSGLVVAKAADAPPSTWPPEDPAPVPTPSPDDGRGPSQEHLRRQAFFRQEPMARSQARLRLLHDGATYAQALRKTGLRGRWRSNHAAALASAKPKGPPAHLVGTESRAPFGGVATGSPEVTPTPAVQRRHCPAVASPR